MLSQTNIFLNQVVTHFLILVCVTLCSVLNHAIQDKYFFPFSINTQGIVHMVCVNGEEKLQYSFENKLSYDFHLELIQRLQCIMEGEWRCACRQPRYFGVNNAFINLPDILTMTVYVPWFHNLLLWYQVTEIVIPTSSWTF